MQPDESAEFDEILKQLGYIFMEETNNLVPKRHLQG